MIETFEKITSKPLDEHNLSFAQIHNFFFCSQHTTMSMIPYSYQLKYLLYIKFLCQSITCNLFFNYLSIISNIPFDKCFILLALMPSYKNLSTTWTRLHHGDIRLELLKHMG
jgi:hypothetical protein